MGNSITEVNEYIYKNFTYQDKVKAIDYYRAMTGADLATACNEIDKIYAQRKADGRELPMPKAWTPSGQQYEKGKRLFGAGRLLLIVTIISMVGCSIAIIHSIRKTVNEVSVKERQEWLDNGFEAFRTQGGVVEVVKNYYRPSGTDWRSLYVFRPEQEGDLYWGVLSTEWWFHYDDFYAKGLEFFYADAGMTESVELEDGTICKTVIVPVENVMVGYGIASDNVMIMQMAVIAGFCVVGILMAGGFILMMVLGKKKMKNNPM